MRIGDRLLYAVLALTYVLLNLLLLLARFFKFLSVSAEALHNAVAQLAEWKWKELEADHEAGLSDSKVVDLADHQQKDPAQRQARGSGK